MRWWSSLPDQDITIHHRGLPLTGSSYQVSPRFFLITNINIKCPSHRNLDDLSNATVTLDNLFHLLDLNTSTHKNPGKCQINHWTLLPTVSNTTPFLNPSSKCLCHSVNTTLLPIQAINNHYLYQVLIVTSCFVVAKSPNQRYSLLRS